jgi:hypothetical protein
MAVETPLDNYEPTPRIHSITVILETRMPGLGVALLAKLRRTLFQKCRLIRAMRSMAQSTVFCCWCMFPEKRSPPLRMAAGAGLAQRGLHVTIRAVIAVRVVAGAACHFPFAHGMVRTLVELCTLGLVTLIADFWLQITVQHRIVRDVNLMAAGASYVVEFVETAFPLDALVVFVAFETLAVLFLYRRPAVLAKAQYRGLGLLARDALRMFTTRPVAGLALQARERCAFVSRHGMFGFEDREYGIIIILVMTLEAGICATLGVFTLLNGLHRGPGCFNCHPVRGLSGM